MFRFIANLHYGSGGGEWIEAGWEGKGSCWRVQFIINQNQPKLERIVISKRPETSKKHCDTVQNQSYLSA